MKLPEQPLDIPNMALSFGEIIQDIRDRRLIAVSAIAGFMEDLGTPKYPAWVRARWSAVRDDNIHPKEGDLWQRVKTDESAGLIPKHKTEAVVLGVDHSAISDLRETDWGRLWPAALFNYKGRSRVGLLPGDFGVVDDQAVVALLRGRSEFWATLGLAWTRRGAFAGVMEGSIKRADLKKLSIWVPPGVRILDEILAEEVPIEIPLV